MNVKIFPVDPKNAPALADFLGQHGFNVGPLTKENFFVTTLQLRASGQINTLESLVRLCDEPKVDSAVAFSFELEA